MTGLAGPRRSRSSLAIGMAIAALLAGVAAPVMPSAHAAQIELKDIELGKGGFVINGRSDGGYTGRTVSRIGDINGDGLADLLIGAPYDYYTDSFPFSKGYAYVVYGKTDTVPVNLDTVSQGVGGFIIDGGRLAFYTLQQTVGVGDINGDGVDDLLVTDAEVNVSKGRSYVIFGGALTSPVMLNDIEAGRGGFIIDGATSSFSGSSVGAAGDVNGDGLADMLISATGEPNSAGRRSGRSYVVFGKQDTAPVSLVEVAQGKGGFLINGADDETSTGAASAGVGDLNGDGLADLLVSGFIQVDKNSRESVFHVVYGKADTAPVSLTSLPRSQGFNIRGFTQTYSFESLDKASAAGDINGDGLADIALLSTASSSVTVLFGKADSPDVQFSDLMAGIGGFAVQQEPGAQRVANVASAGDVNGDGLADILVGAPGGYASPGRTYLVYGKADNAPVQLADVAQGQGGLAINGISDRRQSGLALAGAGDVNGDGIADILMGSPVVALIEPYHQLGHAYVILGSTTGAFAPSAFTQVGDSSANLLTGSRSSDAMAAGIGNDQLLSKGGADVLYGGAGDDEFVLNAASVRALSRPLGKGGNTERLSRIDGGTGLDTLKLAGSGVTLDLTQVAKPGARLPGSYSRIESVERIDLTGSGDNQLVLGVRDVQNMAGMSLVTARTMGARGWQNGSYRFPAAGKPGAQFHQLIVDGDAGDSVQGNTADWRWVGHVSRGGQGYAVFHSTYGRAEVLVNQAVNTVGLTGNAPPR